MRPRENFSSELLIATLLLEHTQRILNERGGGTCDINVAGEMKKSRIRYPKEMIEKCREYIDWYDVDGKF